MSEKLLKREWIGVGVVLGAVLTILIVSKISEKRINNILQKALSEAKTASASAK